MALFQYEGIGSLRSLGNKLSSQRAVYSYSQFSIVNYEELDYGSIVDAVIEAEDYGEITATIKFKTLELLHWILQEYQWVNLVFT
jgi:hypothetical protein